MRLTYVIPRLARHFMPESLARFLLQRGWIIKPGLETSDPLAAAERYEQAVRDLEGQLDGACVLVFGYGGSYAVGVELLHRGARHVILSEHHVQPDRRRNLELLPRYAAFLSLDADGVRPRPEHITLLHGDIRTLAAEPADIFLSTSVLEHVHDVEGVTRALARMTKPAGLHVHFVDLRDHFFRYPFEMLTYSPRVWAGFLNPTSNLNRFRVRDYRLIFERHFATVAIEILERDAAAFAAARRRIRREFLSGEALQDAATLIRITARGPLPAMPGANA